MKQYVGTLVLIIFFITLVTQPIHLVTSDLGRHIKNGELILAGQTDIFAKNVYSYTNPQIVVTNHHWGSGVLFYLLHKIGGFELLSIAATMLLSIALLLFWKIGQRNTTWHNPMIAIILFLPLIVSRTEPRPELFSYLLSGIFLYLLRSNRHLWILPLLEVLWVNLHIYFSLGLIFIILHMLLTKRPNIALLLACIAATLINPNGWRGTIAPVTLLTNYGYRLLENRPLINIPLTASPFIQYVWFALFVSAAAIFVGWRKKHHLLSVLLLLIGVVATFASIRNAALFGFLGIAMVPHIAQPLFKRRVFMGILAIFFALLVLKEPAFWFKRPVGIGLDIDAQNLSGALEKMDIEGPIFNNYDIGSYLIYQDLPVFVDNRPEAYPTTFFSTIYIPMQTGSTWDKMQKTYDFRTIIFAKTDATAWGRQFIESRRHDQSWRLVYENEGAIIWQRK